MKTKNSLLLSVLTLVVVGFSFSSQIYADDCSGGSSGPGCDEAGCMDSKATNYNSNATTDDGSCKYGKCGDGTCDAGEDSCSCEADCGYDKTCEPYCGDATCDSGEECKCALDCGPKEKQPSCTYCGNAKCDSGETSCSCSYDCQGSTASCGLNAPYTIIDCPLGMTQVGPVCMPNSGLSLLKDLIEKETRCLDKTFTSLPDYTLSTADFNHTYPGMCSNGGDFYFTGSTSQNINGRVVESFSGVCNNGLNMDSDNARCSYTIGGTGPITGDELTSSTSTQLRSSTAAGVRLGTGAGTGGYINNTGDPLTVPSSQPGCGSAAGEIYTSWEDANAARRLTYGSCPNGDGFLEMGFNPVIGYPLSGTSSWNCTTWTVNPAYTMGGYFAVTSNCSLGVTIEPGSEDVSKTILGYPPTNPLSSTRCGNASGKPYDSWSAANAARNMRDGTCTDGDNNLTNGNLYKQAYSDVITILPIVRVNGYQQEELTWNCTGWNGSQYVITATCSLQVTTPVNSQIPIITTSSTTIVTTSSTSLITNPTTSNTVTTSDPTTSSTVTTSDSATSNTSNTSDTSTTSDSTTSTTITTSGTSGTGQTYSVEGTVTGGGSGLSGVLVDVMRNGTVVLGTVTTANGNYVISGLQVGGYEVRPRNNGQYIFPSAQSVTLVDSNVRANFSGINLTGLDPNIAQLLSNDTATTSGTDSAGTSLNDWINNLINGSNDGTNDNGTGTSNIANTSRTGNSFNNLFSENSLISLLNKGYLPFANSYSPIGLSILKKYANQNAICGNGTIEEGESCDDGVNNGKTDQCSSDCLYVGEVRFTDYEGLGSSVLSSTERGSFSSAGLIDTFQAAGNAISDAVSSALDTIGTRVDTIQDWTKQTIIENTSPETRKILKKTAAIAEEVTKYSLIIATTLLGALAVSLYFMVYKSQWTTYTVQEGDTFDSIGNKFTMTERALRGKNSFLKKGGPRPGTKIRVRNRRFIEKDYLDQLKTVLKDGLEKRHYGKMAKKIDKLFAKK